ncbi:MAG TPA: hypothetical protein VHW45_14730 [Candidatus Sulfotelmatobacter sp.]|jgi:hypothetical protein|nr:hypothetical protein [Candidatus Sulfotelmatobacter sp.]
MRVDYTLPSIEPERTPELPESPETQTAITFRDQLRGPSTDVPVSWQQQMHLDTRPPDAAHLDPPQRPQTMEIRDAETEGKRWRSMLSRQDKSLASANFADSSQKQSVRVMLDMLLDMQHAGDAISAQNAAVTRG